MKKLLFIAYFCAFSGLIAMEPKAPVDQEAAFQANENQTSLLSLFTNCLGNLKALLCARGTHTPIHPSCQTIPKDPQLAEFEARLAKADPVEFFELMAELQAREAEFEKSARN